MNRGTRHVIVPGLVALGLFAPSAYADVLLIEKIASAPTNSAEGVLRPDRGMRMERVLEKFGEPQTRVPAVGEPPISRWVYGDFTVYFEHEHTITSVLTR